MRPEAWGSACLPVRAPDGIEWFDLRSFVHAFPMALRAAPRVRVPDGIYGFRVPGDLFRCLCSIETDKDSAERAIAAANVICDDDDRDRDSAVHDDDGAAAFGVMVTVSCNDRVPGATLSGIAGPMSATEWDPTLACRVALRPNTMLRDLALETDVGHESVRMLSRLFPHIERLYLHRCGDSRRQVGDAVSSLLDRLPRLAALTIGEECSGDYQYRDPDLDDHDDDGDHGDARGTQKGTALPRQMTEFHALAAEGDGEYLSAADEPIHVDISLGLELRVSADRNPSLTALRLENPLTARLLPLPRDLFGKIGSVAEWPPLRRLALAGGVLAPGVSLVDLLRITTLERVSLSHMNLYPDDDGTWSEFSSGRSVRPVRGCRRLDLHNCALGRGAVSNLLRLYPRLADIRVHFLSRDPDCSSRGDFDTVEGDGAARPLDVAGILDAIADSAAFGNGHLRYVHLPMAPELAAFGPPMIVSSGGSGGGNRDLQPDIVSPPDDRDRPHCRCRTKCVFCACIRAKVACDDQCHGNDGGGGGGGEDGGGGPIASAPAEKKSAKKNGGGMKSSGKVAAVTRTAKTRVEWPCREKVRDDDRASVGVTVTDREPDRHAPQCRVLAIECPSAKRARFSAISLLVLPPLSLPPPPPSSLGAQRHVALQSLVTAGLGESDTELARFACFDASLYSHALGRLIRPPPPTTPQRTATATAPRLHPCIVQFSHGRLRPDSWLESDIEPHSSFNGVAPCVETCRRCPAMTGSVAGQGVDGGGGVDGDAGNDGRKAKPKKRARPLPPRGPENGVPAATAQPTCLCSVPVRKWTRVAASKRSSPMGEAAPRAPNSESTSLSPLSATSAAATVPVTSADSRACDATHFVDLALYRADNFYE